MAPEITSLFVDTSVETWPTRPFRNEFGSDSFEVAFDGFFGLRKHFSVPTSLWSG